MAKELPQSFHDCKTETDAARVSCWDLVIFFEDLSDVLSWNSDAAIPDFNASLVCGATIPIVSFAACLRITVADLFI
jgi:hypothetical protein